MESIIEEINKMELDPNFNGHYHNGASMMKSMIVSHLKSLPPLPVNVGVKWVKATQRLPDTGTYYDNMYCKEPSIRSHNVLSLKFNGIPYCGTYYESIDGGSVKSFAIANHDYLYLEKDFDKIEWLDESHSPLTTEGGREQEGDDTGINCPSCGKIWNISKHNSCECGATWRPKGV